MHPNDSAIISNTIQGPAPGNPKYLNISDKETDNTIKTAIAKKYLKQRFINFIFLPLSMLVIKLESIFSPPSPHDDFVYREGLIFTQHRLHGHQHHH